MKSELKVEYYPIIENNVLNAAIEIVEKNKNNWDYPFFIDTKTYLDLENIKRTSKQFISEKLKNVIVLGTGGSIQTVLALNHLSKRKIYPITCSRAVELTKCLENTKPENSLVIPISRGGETLDINSTIGIFFKKGYKFLGLSSMGTMYEILKKLKCPILDVPDLSGRFAGSISNVGIVPAYISGIEIEAFLSGLDEGYKLYMNYGENAAMDFSVFLFNLYNKGYKVVFSMPYSNNLEGSVGVFVQEISESTGKDNKGLLGAYQSAPLCQHSILEYFLGGTKGAIVPILWTIDNDHPDIVLESSIDYVNGLKAQEIVNYQADATFQALIEQGVPSAKISIDKPDEVNVGNLIAFIQSSIYYFCLLTNVNWADNPKVAIGKKICIEALISKTPIEERIKKREKIAKEKFHNFF